MKHAFIDESKAKGYFFAVYIVQSADLVRFRKILSLQLLKGQRSLHFAKESVRRRKEIIHAMETLNPKLFIIRTKTKDASATRMKLIQKLVPIASELELDFLTFDLDETTLFKDRLFLKLATKATYRNIHWDHRQRHEEPLLWVADAVAWCVNRGGEWERIVRPMIVETIEC